MRNSILLLTAPFLDGPTGSTTPPSRAALASAAVQTAFQTLQTDLNNDIPNGAKPTHESVSTLQDDLDAIRKGTLSGSTAQTKIESDQAAILGSMGLTQAQITQIQSDQKALQTAIQAAPNGSTSATTSGSASGGASSSTKTTSASSSPAYSAIQSAYSTLRTDLQNDTPGGARPTFGSMGAVRDDLDAIRSGTLTGTAAVSKVQADTAAVLSSMGLTSTQISQIQSDQEAVETAVQENSGTATVSPGQTTTGSTLQSVAGYLVGLPGDSGIRPVGNGGFGMGGMRGFGMGPARRARGGYSAWH
jgi:hypothetical protein